MNCCDKSNNSIKQGTTFSLSVDFTGTGFSLDNAVKIEFMFKRQRSKDAADVKSNVWKSDGTGDSTRIPNTNTILVPFTETDTYLFNEGQVFYMDTKIYLTGSAQNPPTNICEIMMSDTLFDGEIDPSIGTLEVNANGTYDAPEGHYYNRVIVNVEIDFDDINDRPKYNGVEMTSDTDIPAVPTKTSDLENDSGFITDGDIPSKTSDLINDSGFITEDDVPTQLAELSEDSTHRTVTDEEKATWNGKQNAIEDLDDIRSGAEKGETAVQPSALNAYRTSAEQDAIDSDKLTEPSSGLAVGKYFRIAEIDENGHAILEAVDAPNASMKIKIAGTAQTPDADGYVDVPIANAANAGLNKIIFGTDAPTSSTPADFIGQTYIYYTSYGYPRYFECYNIKDGSYSWAKKLISSVLANGGDANGAIYLYGGLNAYEHLYLPVTTDEGRLRRRKGNNASYGSSIFSSNYDLAVKLAMCDPVGTGDSTSKALAWTDAEKLGAWTRLSIIKTTLDNVLVPNAQYYLGEQSSLTLTLPSTADNGNIITVDFESGATATSLSITGDVAGDVNYAPSANTLVELSFKRSNNWWKLLTSSVDTPSEVSV